MELASKDPLIKSDFYALIFMAVALLAVASSWMFPKISGIFIMADMELDIDYNIYVVAVFVIAQASIMPIAGKMMDRFGEKMVFLVSVSMFVLGTLICAISFDLGSLLTGRIMAGFGSGGIFAICVSSVGTLFPVHHRGTMQGIMTAAFAIGSFMGISIGVWSYETIGWRYGFVLLALLGVIGAAGAAHFLSRRKVIEREKLDWFPLVFMFAAMMLLMTYTQLVNEEFDFVSTTSILCIVAFVALVVLFAFFERRSCDPILPKGLHRDQIVLIASLFVVGILVLSVLQMIIRIYLLCYDLDVPDAIYHASFMLLLLIVGGAGPSIYCTHRIHKLGLKPCVRLGSLVIAVALILSFFLMDEGLIYMAACIILLGAGLGLIVTELLITLQNLTPVKHMGAVSSTAMGIRLVGIVSGIAVFSKILKDTLIHDASEYISDIEQYDSLIEILIYILEHTGPAIEHLCDDYVRSALDCMIPGIIGAVIVFILTFFIRNIGKLEDE